MAATKTPTVCIVGRPNVGKSTLFNRIIGKRKAVVHETSGTTRDRNEEMFERDGRTFRLVDTGGFMKLPGSRIMDMVKAQIDNAMEEADLLLFVCDAADGLTPQDEELAITLRKTSRSLLLVANKSDNKKIREGVYDFYQLGLGDPHPVSAIHNLGIEELLDDIAKNFCASDEKGESKENPVYKIAIAGRPNVGKSLFLNTLLDKERVIVDDIPGTTRDSVDTYFEKDGLLYLVIDTAGIRHKRKVKEAIDVYSISRSHEAIERSDAVLLMIDGYDGLRNDDVRVLNFAINAGKCCVIVVNKWDLVKQTEMSKYKDAILHKFPVAGNYPIVFTSAKTSRNVLSCIDMVKYVVTNSCKKVDTNDLYKFLGALKKAAARVGMKRPPKLHYIVQTNAKPPVFLVFISQGDAMPDNFTNFIENRIRKSFDFYGTPIKINYRRKKS
ncbi:MAG: ribosome biogenesis GTPase Der [Candidatus Omnitrophota bacterium]